MSKKLAQPMSRLVCAGNAKACTNAGSGDNDELDGGPKFN